MLLPFRDHTYFRLISTRTSETIFEAKMLDGSIMVWGAHYQPAEFDALLADDGQTVSLVGTLRDRIGPVVTFGDCLDVRAAYSVEVGDLPADYDPSWSRDNTYRRQHIQNDRAAVATLRAALILPGAAHTFRSRQLIDDVSVTESPYASRGITSGDAPPLR